MPWHVVVVGCERDELLLAAVADELQEVAAGSQSLVMLSVTVGDHASGRDHGRGLDLGRHEVRSD